MVVYHISRSGEPAICNADKESCPLNPQTEHYDSYEAAAEAQEQKMANKTIQAFSKKKAYVPDSPERDTLQAKLNSVSAFAVDLKNSSDSEGNAKINTIASEMISERVKSSYDSTDEMKMDIENLKNLQEEFNRNGHIADYDGDTRKAHSWWVASESLADYTLELDD